MPPTDSIIDSHEPILITGSNGFIGSSVVETLLRYGFRNLRCFVRPSSNLSALDKVRQSSDSTAIEIIRGNLLSRQDCNRAVQDVSVIYHLAAGIEKSFPGSFMNSVVTTRNLLDAALQAGTLKRFVNVSSFAVYSNWNIRRGGLLDESCQVENRPLERFEPYTYAKLKQDELVLEYADKYGIPYVILRPGAVYGPGKAALTGRVGLGTFGFFLHLGGSNRIPLTYVDNCAEAIVLAGIREGVQGEVFNIVDDDLPSSRQVLRLYKRNAGHFRSLYMPYRLFYLCCYLWEKYSRWSEGQLPPAFNRRRCATYWKGNRYSNQKLKKQLGWAPSVPSAEAQQRFAHYLRQTRH